MNVMAIEDSPIYEAIISELGNPIPLVPMDCTYEAVLVLAGRAPEQPAAAVSLPAPPKRPFAKATAPKLMASVAREAG